VKQPLSRDLIVSEALRQLTADGPKGMSLRKVAAALDTGPASLYAYVDDLDALHALVLDRALAKVDVRGSAKAGWREHIVSVLESYARVLSASPGLAQLAFGTVAIGPNALRINEALLALLEEAGVALATGAWAVDLLVLYVTAIVAEHSDGLNPSDPEAAVARALAGVREHEHPRTHAAREHLLSGTASERFAWSLDVLLAGILQSPRTPSGGSGRKLKAPEPAKRRARKR
jgi:AcrR family transcriptional regulator